jgi:flagellum-specific peptidoglycan hydrolase FlgJ
MSRFPTETIAAAEASQAKWAVPASLVLAQWALESAYGAHAPGGNPFGIKARPGEPSQTLMTWEHLEGRDVRVPQQFRRFASVAEAFDSHGRLIAHNWPAACHVSGEVAAKAVVAGRLKYATDPKYTSKLITIMRANALGQYDHGAGPLIA